MGLSEQRTNKLFVDDFDFREKSLLNLMEQLPIHFCSFYFPFMSRTTRVGLVSHNSTLIKRSYMLLLPPLLIYSSS